MLCGIKAAGSHGLPAGKFYIFFCPLDGVRVKMTTPLFLLRCVQIGLSISELDLLTIGTVNDMYAEMSNDDYNYPALATQEQMDRF